METTKTNNQWIKKSVRQGEMPEDKTGFELVGEFNSVAEKPYETIEDGEIKEKIFRQLVITQNGELVAYPCDAGLLQQIELVGLKKGDLFKAVNLGKTKIKGTSRSMNVWDLFVAGN